MAGIPQYSDMVFKERTGKRRTLRITGRALPYQGVQTPLYQRVRTVWYGGNPIATQQIYGPRLGPITMKGYWKDRYLEIRASTTSDSLREFGVQVEIEGNNATPNATLDEQPVRSGRALVEAFFSMLRDGQEIELAWDESSWIGVLKSVVPQWITAKDVKWSMNFEPRQEGGATVQPKFRAAYRAVETVQGWAGKISDFLNTISNAVEKYPISWLETVEANIDRLSKLNRQIQATQNSMNEVVFTSDRIARKSLALVEDVAETLYFTISDFTDLNASSGSRDGASVSMVRAWSSISGTVIEARILMGEAVRDRAAARAQVLDESENIVSILRVKGDTSAYRLAVRFYGSFEGYDQILSFNGLVDPIIPAGTLVYIPVKT